MAIVQTSLQEKMTMLVGKCHLCTIREQQFQSPPPNQKILKFPNIKQETKEKKGKRNFVLKVAVRGEETVPAQELKISVG